MSHEGMTGSGNRKEREGELAERATRGSSTALKADGRRLLLQCIHRFTRRSNSSGPSLQRALSTRSGTCRLPPCTDQSLLEAIGAIAAASAYVNGQRPLASRTPHCPYHRGSSRLTSRLVHAASNHRDCMLDSLAVA
ncbi:hypothetical protein NA57DRAFT_60635 [Rhizodiscina lignyota]|uniref:Uncharacterized protein n=1 Tax=Rhizodiscina lignyota TaxID=1504668 RepID=A0A9P4I3V9_9PEZI|nr:hypothetical protein NA57DRAFT_60635 [Rhizodiscina lignyota]